MKQAGQWRWLFRHDRTPVTASPSIASAPLINVVMERRDLGGLTPEAFLQPSLATLSDPFALMDMDKAADRFAQAIRGREPIVIFGDYDADGATATALLVRLVRHCGGLCEYYIPHRIDEGYGVGAAALRQISAKGARLVVTVDTGISGLDAAEVAAELGLDLIITDHHQPGPSLPRALAVVNPNRRDCTSPTPGLAGVGVAFKLAHATLKRLEWDGKNAREFLAHCLELVAIGSVADFAPLTGENRVMVRHGLNRLANTRSVGLQALLRAVRPGRVSRPVSTTEIGFQIGPRINAAGRTSAAGICVELLTTADPLRAEEIAMELEAHNRERRRIEDAMLAECLAMLEKDDSLAAGPVAVLSGMDWHPGVVGIVAARVLQRIWRPTIILSVSNGLAKGSARSIPGYDIFAALSSCRDLLEKFGGHPAAAGMTLRADQIEELRRSLNNHASNFLSAEDLVPEVLVDAVARPDQIDRRFVEELTSLEPFGQANPTPVLAFLGVPLAAPPSTIKQKHLKLHIASDTGGRLCAMGWNMTVDSCGLTGAKTVDVAFHPVVSMYQGSETVELRLVAARPAREASN